MIVHCIALGDSPVAATFNTLCGGLAMHAAQITDVADQVTCEDCCIRLLARTHHDLTVLLKNLAARIVELRKQAESAVKRD